MFGSVQLVPRLDLARPNSHSLGDRPEGIALLHAIRYAVPDTGRRGRQRRALEGMDGNLQTLARTKSSGVSDAVRLEDGAGGDPQLVGDMGNSLTRSHLVLDELHASRCRDTRVA